MTADVVGREAELEAMSAFLGMAEGRSGTLVLDGVPGIGKSTLWRAGVESARGDGFRVLACRPAAAESSLAYSALADLLAGVGDEVLKELPDPQRRALDGVLMRGDADAAPADRRAAGAGLLGVLGCLAAVSPVLLAIDDLQWVDRSSVLAIEFAVRRLDIADVAVSVLASVRSGEDAVLSRLAEPGREQRIRLDGLSLGAMHRMLLDRLGESFPRPEMVRIHEVSGGNPFYALELARVPERNCGAPSLPADLGRLVESRVKQVAPRVREALLAVAASAEPTAELVRRAVEADVEEGERLIDAAERAGLLRIEGHRVRFTHPLLSAGVLGAAAPGARRAVHRRLAGLVDDPEQRARHLALSAVYADEETVASLDEAAARARFRGAPAAAAELLELAVGLGAGTPERRLALGGHQFAAGTPVRARELAVDLVAELGPGVLRARALLLLASVHLLDDSYPDAADQLIQALAEAGDERALWVKIALGLQYALLNLGRFPELLALAEETIATAEALDDPALLARALAIATMAGFAGGQGLAEARLRRAVELEDPEEEAHAMVRPGVIAGVLRGWTGHLDEAVTTLHALHRRFRERGEEHDVVFTAHHLVMFECWRGNFARARQLAEDTGQRAQQLGTGIPETIGLTAKALVAAYAGQLDEAREAAERALALFEAGRIPTMVTWPRSILGFVAVSEGNYAGVLAALEPLVPTPMGFAEPRSVPCIPDAVEALIGLGRLPEAVEYVSALDAGGGAAARLWTGTIGTRCQAMILAAQGDLDAAAEAVERAVAGHDRMPMPFERGRTLLVAGRVHRRRRRKRAAAEALRAALEVFESLGTPLWAAQARAELERVTHVSGSSAGTGPAKELSPAELRVAELTAAGMTNREVAATLFISPKTVEANLGRIYRKLGIRSRAELGQRMGNA